jgi:putative transposase
MCEIQLEIYRQGAGMKKNYSEEQIIKILTELEVGFIVNQINCKHGVHVNALYKWRQKHAGMSVSDVHRLRNLEDENSRLKQIVADQALDIVVLKGKSVTDLLDKVIKE